MKVVKSASKKPIKLRKPIMDQTAPRSSAQKVEVNKDSPVISMVKISHTQGIKQSKAYQTGDVSYSVELFVHNDEKAIKAGLLQAETIVEDALGGKLPQMCEILDQLAEKNR